MPHSRLSLAEAADYLHLATEDLEVLVKRREVPFEKSGSRTTFVRGDLDAWASQRLLGFNVERLADYHKKTSAKMYDLSKNSLILSELLNPGRIVPALTSRTKSSVMRDMVDLADLTGLLNDKAGMLQGIVEREKLCSTALSGGLAILHAQHHDRYLAEDSFVVLGCSVQPLPFGSPDGRTTDIFFLVCCQDERIHLHVLARICMLCYHTPLLMELREQTTADGMYETITAHERELVRGMR